MLAMAAITATLETIHEDSLMARAGAIQDQIRAAVGPRVRSVRGRGCLLGLELDVPAKPVLAALREAGVLAGGSGHPNVLRLMPPLTASDADVALFTETFARVLTAEPVK